MSIADVLHPRMPAAIAGTRLIQTSEDTDMTNAEKVVAAIRGAGGRITRADLKTITELEGQALDSGIYLAKKSGWIDRDGADYVIKKGAPTVELEPAPPGGKKAKKPRAKKAAKVTRAAPSRALVAVKPRAPVTVSADGCRALLLIDGGMVVIDGTQVSAELAAPQVAAIARLFRG